MFISFMMLTFSRLSFDIPKKASLFWAQRIEGCFVFGEHKSNVQLYIFPMIVLGFLGKMS